VPTALGYLTKVGTVAAAIIFTAVLLKKRRVS